MNRRTDLINHMQDLAEQGMTCASCSGLCCTFMKNSMRITPLEALEIYTYLEESNRWNDELKERLKLNIKEFRLDSTLLMGKRNSFRRTYTCPFFKDQKLGCSLSRTVKPYGCLAFNAGKKEESDGESCRSDQELLLAREQKYDGEERQRNEDLRTKLGLPWDKESIPIALLDVAAAYGEIK